MAACGGRSRRPGGGTTMQQVGGKAPQVWRVGDLRVDVGRQVVVRDGYEIPLPKLSFDLLMALVRAAPNVLSSDELMTQVWPGLVVSPETLVQRVKLLREALADAHGGESRYVLTVRGRGYRLIASVSLLPQEALVEEVERQASPTSPPVSTEASAAPSSGSPSAVQAARAKEAGRPAGRDLRYAWPAVAALLMAVIVASVLREPRAGREPPAPSGSEAVAGDAIRERQGRTVAVLPFRNLSADPSDAYIALSLPEMTLNRLSTIEGLSVVARDSSFHFNAPLADVREAGRALNAAWLVEGSVQRLGDQLRVTARLIDAREGVQVWATSFDRPLARLYEVQDGIADQVATTLASRIEGMRRARPGGARSDNIEAYLAYLRGRALIGRFTVAEAEAAAAQFERAIALDPEFAAAHAALFDARMQAAGLRRDALAPVRARYRPSLERALALDPNDGMAHFARAMWDDLDDREREAAFRRAALLDPSNSRGLIAFSEFLDITDAASPAARVRGSGFDPTSERSGGRTVRGIAPGARAGEAGQILERVLWIDPLSARARFRNISRNFRAGRTLPEDEMLALLELDPQFYPALQRTAKYRSFHHGHFAESIAIIEQAIRVDPANPWGPHTAVSFYLDIDDVAAARAVAALTPFSSDSARPVLEQQAGHWREAAAAARGPRGYAFGFNESWGVVEALRDAALREGDIGATIVLLRERYSLPAGEPPRLDVANFRVTVPLAHLLLRQGSRDEARVLLREAVRWIDADTRFGSLYKRRTRAQAMMLLGEPELALRDLAASFAEDFDYSQWWYTQRLDPVFDALRGDPRFVAIFRGVASHVSLERQAVERMRERGEIPRRGGPGGGARG